VTPDQAEDFRRGYVAAAMFTAFDEQDARLTRATRRAIARDCAAFLGKAAPLIAACEDRHTPGSGDDTAWNHAGRDFWYTREGHGCGFWDGDWPDPEAAQLAALAKGFGPADWYDARGWIYQSGDEAA